MDTTIRKGDLIFSRNSFSIRLFLLGKTGTRVFVTNTVLESIGFSFFLVNGFMVNRCRCRFINRSRFIGRSRLRFMINWGRFVDRLRLMIHRCRFIDRLRFMIYRCRFVDRLRLVINWSRLVMLGRGRAPK